MNWLYAYLIIATLFAAWFFCGLDRRNDYLQMLIALFKIAAACFAIGMIWPSMLIGMAVPRVFRFKRNS